MQCFTPDLSIEKADGGCTTRFRLCRVIVASLFGSLGLFALVGGAVVLIICLTAAVGESGELATRYLGQIPGLMLIEVAGCLWLFSAVAWWRGWWCWAILSSFIGFIAAAISELLIIVPG